MGEHRNLYQEDQKRRRSHRQPAFPALTDAIEKALRKLTAKERSRVKGMLAKLAVHNLQGLDIKKIQGRDDICRVSKGDLRIVYRLKEGSILVLLIERRGEKTYDS